MKNRLKDKSHPPETIQLIAEFGDARLLRNGAKVILEGGSMADRLDAIEWARENLPGIKVTTKRAATAPIQTD